MLKSTQILFLWGLLLRVANFFDLKKKRIRLFDLNQIFFFI